jgi:hypothetical protein
MDEGLQSSEPIATADTVEKPAAGISPKKDSTPNMDSAFETSIADRPKRERKSVSVFKVEEPTSSKAVVSIEVRNANAMISV